MIFRALTSGELWLLLGAAFSLAAVMNLLKVRRRVVRVPFGRLWSGAGAAAENALWRRLLRRLLSLAVQLLFLGLVILALADPAIETAGQAAPAGPPSSVVLALDVSASMMASDSPAGSRFDEARRRARDAIAGLPPGATAQVVSFAGRVDPLGPFTSDKDALLAGLALAVPSDSPTASAPLAAYLGNVLAGRPAPTTVVFTDGAFNDGDLRPPGGIEARIERVGSSGRNLAIEAFSVRPEPGDPLSYDLLLRVRSHMTEPARAALVLYALRPESGSRLRPEDAFSSVALNLAPGESVERVLTGLRFPGRRVAARLEAPGAGDVSPRDDIAFALVPERRKLRVALVTPGNLFLSAALLLRENVDLSEMKPGEFSGPEGFDVVVLDRMAPPGAPGNYLLFAPPGGQPFGAAGELTAPRITRVDPAHPLLAGTRLVDVNISVATALRAGADDRVAVWSGRSPLVVMRDDGPMRVVAVGFDLARSDFPLRAAFPLFMANALAVFAREDDSYIETLRTGRAATLAVPWKTGRVSVVFPDGTRTVADANDGAVTLTPPVAGFTTASMGRNMIEIAASLFDPDESSVAPRGEAVQAPARRPAAAVPKPSLDLWIILLLGALAVLAVEWVSYHRRVTT